MNAAMVAALMASGSVFFLLKALRGKSGYSTQYPPLQPFQENRVRLNDYGPLRPDDPRLVQVPSTKSSSTLHTLAAKRFMALRDAAERDGFPDVRISSGYREDRAAYKRGPDGRKSRAAFEAYLLERYGSVKEGYRWLAFDSPHETGLALDFGNHGLQPTSANNAEQMRTPFYRWLVNNAYRFGLTPYKGEAWHWEFKIPRDAWASGEEFTNDYAVRV